MAPRPYLQPLKYCINPAPLNQPWFRPALRASSTKCIRLFPTAVFLMYHPIFLSRLTSFHAATPAKQPVSPSLHGNNEANTAPPGNISPFIRGPVVTFRVCSGVCPFESAWHSLFVRRRPAPTLTAGLIFFHRFFTFPEKNLFLKIRTSVESELKALPHTWLQFCVIESRK